LPRLFSILLFAAPALCAAEPASGEKKNPVSLLPDGSVLKGVLLPRYDENHKLVGDLKAQTMTLIDPEHVRGKNVLIRFYNPDRTLRGKVALKNALFDQVKSRLFAREPVEITTDRLVARGTGLVYAFQGGEGFLRGPSETWISAPPTTTSMNSSTLPNAALFALCFAQAPLTAMPPAFVSEEEIAAIKEQSASVQPEADEINAATETALTADTAAGNEASKAALAFINTSGLETIAAEPEKEPEAKPLEVKPGPDDTLITCDGGMYFDADEGVLVYLKNVTVKDPRFDLKGADQLKVFFDKKPEDKKTVGDAPKKAAGGVANFGDVRKLIAEGAVVLNQKSVGGKDPVQASGRVLTYDIPTGEIIIHGGYPWVKQGAYYARAKEPNLTLRLLNNGSFSTQGNWEMGGNLNLKGN
jgi:lipopolysaccharide export system protein LptA